MAARRAMAMVLVLWASVAPGCIDSRPPAPDWSDQLRAVEEALARNDLRAAVRAWHEGHGAALRSRTWVSLVEMGDAYMRIGTASELPSSGEPIARQAYLRALLRAQAQGSVQGTLRVALAFDELGDTQVVTHCMKIAEGLARRRGDPREREQVTLERERLAQRLASRQDVRR